MRQALSAMPFALPSATPIGRYALCTMCIGVGQGIAMVIERAWVRIVHLFPFNCVFKTNSTCSFGAENK